jgi:DNA polymerase/3'-5' exonuclease PolX
MMHLQLTQTIHLVPPMAFKPRRGASPATQPMLPGLEAAPVEKPAVTNRQIAEVFSNIADILEFQHGNPYRVQAYRHAARGILDLVEPASTILARGDELPVPGLGQRLRRRVAELIETGTMTFYNDLYLHALPQGVRSMMAIPLVGVRTAVRLYEELGIDTPEKLQHAAHLQHIRHLPGFGPRSEARLLAAVERFLRRKSGAPLDGAA